MIVLDENLDEPDVMPPLQRWIKGKIVCLRDLRRGSMIKDEAVPRLLSQQKHATFLTTNVTDFWGRVMPNSRYCVICVLLPNERQAEIPDLLRRLFRLPQFKTKAARMGKVARVSAQDVRYYEAGRRQVRVVKWQ